MYSLLVVDDEKWVQQEKNGTINWESEKIRLIGSADVHEEAWNRLMLNVPDILIADIHTLGDDGLALIESIKNVNRRIKVIVLSKYSDFCYAQKAIRCGAFDYVLKPIKETELLEVLRRCVRELDREEQVRNRPGMSTGFLQRSSALADPRLMELALTGQPAYPLGRMENEGGTYDSHTGPGNMLLAVVKILDWGKVRTHGRDRPAIRYDLGKLAEETCARWGEALSCPLNNHEDADLVILYNGLTDELHEKKEKSFVKGLTLFAQSAGQHLDVQLSVGVSGEFSWAKLHQTFDEAVHACAYAYYEGPGKIHSVRKLPKLPGAKRPYRGPNASWENRIFHAMKLGDIEQVQHLVEELCEHVRASKDKYAPLSVYRGLTSLIRNVIHRWAASSPNGPERLNGPFTVQLPADGFSGLRDYLGPMFQKYCHEAKSGGSRNKIIELALDYIEEHFTEDIMMSMVAKDHYVNPSYFSKLFHEETGETFSKYVARLRIEKAKQLLKNSTLKIYEITLQVGYNDFRHFIKTFKQMEGITPAQYRNLGS